jgi:hypothetical protein
VKIVNALRSIVLFALAAAAQSFVLLAASTGGGLIVAVIATTAQDYSAWYSIAYFVGVFLIATAVLIMLLRLIGVDKWLAPPAMPTGVDPTAASVQPGSQYRAQPSQAQPYGSASLPADRRSTLAGKRYFYSEHMLLAEVAENSRIIGKTFEQCHFYGPAIVTFHQSDRVRIGWDPPGDPDAMFFPVPPRPVMGVVAFSDCRLADCQFHGVGVLGTIEELNEMRAEFGLPPYVVDPIPAGAEQTPPEEERPDPE